MCGISGAVGAHLNAPQTALHRSLDAISHRGPDGQGTYFQSQVCMGMRRLAIIDLEGGDQPIYNEDETVAVVFNGEIYNYRELMAGLKSRGHTFATDSDTEVLVHLYEEKGERMLEDLRGMFAFSIHDTRDGSLFLARDRFGKKPLYYTRPASGGLLYASELKALRPLARAAGERWQINDQAIYDYLSLGVVPQPSTVYLGVYALPPGSWMRFREEHLEIQAYWQPEFHPKLTLSYDEAKERTRAEIGEATRLRLRSDVPLGVFLSGGVDSSVIAYEAAQQLGSTLQTFTVATGEGFDESPVAQRTAAHLGVKNTILKLEVSPLEGLQEMVRAYDQPYSDSSAIPSLGISRLARQHVTVVLNGDGGDEVFAGYRRYVAAVRSAALDVVPKGVARTLAAGLAPFAGARRSPLGFAARFTRGLALSPAERYLAWTTDMLREGDKQRVWRGGPVLPTEERIAAIQRPELGALDGQLATDARINLLSDLLVKMDIATMAHSLEGRSPLLDHRVAEFAWRLPDAYRVRGGTPKAVLRDAYRSRLPDEVIGGAKRGFEIPLVRWLQGELRPILLDTLGGAEALVRGYVDGAFIDALLRREVMTDRNWAYIVYALLVLELWLQEEKSRE
ncbi:asparagine synthase (glutamine-hydrolyzing) [Deinococcus deserti]|uniref:asparagine synthase (glutamine-hydrolyzing) n=2 Tax=Deinococcus TaxID=1298 RepID=C1CY84_DEIDV|nr:asparagine synthase (glutamine-hydrolyzing) [Deinococcus deserti]ACO47040.2 putative asparagine synthetase (glutamine-hydrolyzing) [Deinococcus deserti VCD115]